MIFALAALLLAATEPAMTDGEVWNEGVSFYRDGDVTNALKTLRPLLLSKTHGARAAEVVAKLEYEKGNLEEAANAAQIALRAAPEDAKANRNFTRATDRLPAIREEDNYDMFLVINRFRPLTPDAVSTIEVMREIEGAASLKFTGIINNSNLGAETQPEDVIASAEYAEEVARLSGLPLVLTSCEKSVAPALEGKVPGLFPMKLQKRPV